MSKRPSKASTVSKGSVNVKAKTSCWPHIDSYFALLGRKGAQDASAGLDPPLASIILRVSGLLQTMATQLAEDEESYYEEVEVSGSYTEEEYEEEVIESPVRPPHPLFGGGGNAALLNQIKARGATPAASQAVSQSNPTIRKPVPVPQSPKITSPRPKPAGQLSMAEQVAMMAAKRQQRLDGGESPKETPVSPVVPTPPPRPVATPSQKATEAPKKKKGFFGGGGKPKSDAGKTKITPKPTPRKVAPQAPPAAEPHIIKSYKPEPISSPVVPAPAGAFTQDRLKPTGRREDKPAPALVAEAPAQELATPSVPITTTTKTTTVTKTKRVTKSDPEYDIVEYKVGCFCTVM